MKLAPDATHASRATVATGSGTGTVNWRTPELQSLAKVLEGEILTTGDAVSTSRRGSPLVYPKPYLQANALTIPKTGNAHYFETPNRPSQSVACRYFTDDFRVLGSA
jgi:hypothetical protein